MKPDPYYIFPPSPLQFILKIIFVILGFLSESFSRTQGKEPRTGIIKALAIYRGLVKAHTLKRTDLMVSNIQIVALILQYCYKCGR